MEKHKPVIVPYNARNHKGRNKYVAFCGVCGNPIEKYTSIRFCQFCGAKQDWNDTPYVTRYTLTERAIEYGMRNN